MTNVVAQCALLNFGRCLFAWVQKISFCNVMTGRCPYKSREIFQQKWKKSSWAATGWLNQLLWHAVFGFVFHYWLTRVTKCLHIPLVCKLWEPICSFLWVSLYFGHCLKPNSRDVLMSLMKIGRHFLLTWIPDYQILCIEIDQHIIWRYCPEKFMTSAIIHNLHFCVSTKSSQLEVNLCQTTCILVHWQIPNWFRWDLICIDNSGLFFFGGKCIYWRSCSCDYYFLFSGVDTS